MEKRRLLFNKEQKNKKFFSYNFLKKNRKADIPITILVIGVFVVSTLTLLNFYFEGFKDNNFFEGVILIKKVSEFSEEIKFYNSLKKNSLEFTGLSQGIEEDGFEFKGNFEEGFYEIKGTLYEKEFFGVLTGKELVSVEYNFPR